MHRQQRQLVRALTELYERERSPWIGMDFGGQHDEKLNAAVHAMLKAYRGAIELVDTDDSGSGNVREPMSSYEI